MTIEDFLIASFFTLLLGSLIVVPILASYKMKKALRETAAQLRATRCSTQGDPQMMDAESYEGMFKGFRVRIALGWRVYTTGGKLIPLQGIYVEVFHPTPIPFPIEIERKGLPLFSSCKTGDAEFDKKCVVASESAEEAVKLLGDTMLRKQIQIFLLGQQGMAHITSEAVTTRFINAWKGAPLLLNTIFECARVSAAIRKRLG
jgi:hypothetical protein